MTESGLSVTYDGKTYSSISPSWYETDPEYAKKVDESNERMKKALRDYMDEKVLEMLREKDGAN